MLVIKKQFPYTVTPMNYTYIAIGVAVFILTIATLRIVNAGSPQTAANYESSQFSKTAKDSSDKNPIVLTSQEETNRSTDSQNRVATPSKQAQATQLSTKTNTVPANEASPVPQANTQPTPPNGTPTTTADPTPVPSPSAPPNEQEDDSSLLGGVLKPVVGIVDAVL